MRASFWAAAAVMSASLLSAQGTITSLPTDSAFAYVKRLNDARHLLPQSEWWFGRQLENVRPGSCFGIALPSGLRLVGESSGRNYGIQSFTVDAAGRSIASVLVGVFHAEFPFAVEGKSFLKGSYLVWARPDSLIFTGDDSTIARRDNRGRAFPRETRAAVRLSSPLPDSLITEKAVSRPQVMVELKAQSLVFRVLEHEFLITPRS